MAATHCCPLAGAMQIALPVTLIVLVAKQSADLRGGWGHPYARGSCPLTSDTTSNIACTLAYVVAPLTMLTALCSERQSVMAMFNSGAAATGMHEVPSLFSPQCRCSQSSNKRTCREQRHLGVLHRRCNARPVWQSQHSRFS